MGVPLFLLLLLGWSSSASCSRTTSASSTRHAKAPGWACARVRLRLDACTDVDNNVIAAFQRVVTSPGSQISVGNISQVQIYRANPRGPDRGPDQHVGPGHRPDGRWRRAPVRVVDGSGRGATFTGSECLDWAGGRAGDGYAAQGNILVSAETVDAIVDAFAATAGRPLAERLIDCLAAAQAAGGDRRGQQSAALLVVERDGGYANLSDILVDLRIDDHERPVEELRRLYGLHHALFGKTPRGDWLPVDDALRDEIGERLARIGLRRWTTGPASANLEERVDGTDSIDPVVLEALRDAS